jgi:alpha-beta hydrolase superfamily lysophospholipase
MRGVIVVVALVAGVAAALGVVALAIASMIPTCVSCIASERAPFVVGADARGPALASPARDVQHVDVTFAGLRGTLSLPSSSDRLPAAILLHGSGPATRDGETRGDVVRTYDEPFPLLAHIAEVLTARGVIVLRWDKRKPAPSYGALVDDARAALAFLRAHERVDPSRLLVLGHSEGGGLALELTDEPGVVGVVSLAGLLEGFDTGLVHQFDRAALVRAQQADLFGALGIALTGRTYARCFAQPIPDDLEESCVGGGVTNRALRAYIASSRQARDRLRATPVPVLALLGNVDRNVDPDVFATLAEARLNKRIHWRYVANADHALTDVTHDPPALHRDVVAALDAWLR